MTSWTSRWCLVFSSFRWALPMNFLSPSGCLFLLRVMLIHRCPAGEQCPAVVRKFFFPILMGHESVQKWKKPPYGIL